MAVMTHRSRRFAAMASIAIGVLLISVVGIYLILGWSMNRGLSSLEVDGDVVSPVIVTEPENLTLEEIRGEDASQEPVQQPDGLASFPDPGSVRLYPGENLPFIAWDDPWTAQPSSGIEDDLLDGFRPLDEAQIAAVGEMPAATSIGIPAIGLEAPIQELGIIDLGDARQYATPNRVVGHIPETANAGELGNVWLFGHLQSPLRGEGSVFRNLPLIPDKLRKGERVYVVLDGPAGSYLYEAKSTSVIYQDELSLYPSDGATVTLVTCVPALIYDHRLLVTGELVGFKPLSV